MLSVIKIDEAIKWDNIVMNFKNYDIYYLSNYVKAFQIHGDGEPLLFHYDGKNFTAINVVMKRDIACDNHFLSKIRKGAYFDLMTPYGYGGFIIEGQASPEELIQFNNEYCTYCKNKGIISEFVRFHPVINNSKSLNDLYDVMSIGKTVSIELRSTEEMWSNLSGDKRNQIRKAQKSGVKVYWGRSPELLHEFINMYNATMDSKNAAYYYYFKEEFYNTILNDLKYNSIFYYATYEDKIIAMNIILLANHQMHYHLSASYTEYKQFAPANLMLWEAACWGYINGYWTLHLGSGLGGKVDSLYDFKKGFNKNAYNTFNLGRKIFDQKRYDELCQIRNKEREIDESNMYFPAYRA